MNTPLQRHSAAPMLAPVPALPAGRAFTLIELLLVIAVIALLAAMVMPVFGKAKRKAKATACMSNLHQIGVGLFIYIDENANHLPICAGLLPSQDTNLPPISATLLPIVKNKSVFRCPEDFSVYAREKTSYEWNMFFNGALVSSSAGPGTVQGIITKIFEGRVNTPLLGDAEAFHLVQRPGVGRYALYFDGRVKPYEVPLPLKLVDP